MVSDITPNACQKMARLLSDPGKAMALNIITPSKIASSTAIATRSQKLSGSIRRTMPDSLRLLDSLLT
jgi:hypothetical protein